MKGGMRERVRVCKNGKRKTEKRQADGDIGMMARKGHFNEGEQYGCE